MLSVGAAYCGSGVSRDRLTRTVASIAAYAAPTEHSKRASIRKHVAKAKAYAAASARCTRASRIGRFAAAASSASTMSAYHIQV